MDIYKNKCTIHTLVKVFRKGLEGVTHALSRAKRDAIKAVVFLEQTIFLF